MAGTVNYTHDSVGQMEIVSSADGMTAYSYDSAGNLIRTDWPNGTYEIREYDALNRLAFIETMGPEGVISSYRYTLNASGKRVAVEEHDGRRVEYIYDDLYRLIGEKSYEPGQATPARTVAYTYDSVGNRLTRDDSLEGLTRYEYDENDRLLLEILAGDETRYTYDQNGNTLSKTRAVDVVFYEWNSQNELTAVDTDGDGTANIEYEYNLEGIRVSKMVGGAEMRYLVTENSPHAQVIAEYMPGASLAVSYVYGRDVISQERGGTRSYYHVDGHGSTTALSDVDGVVVGRYCYDAFGRLFSPLPDLDNTYLYSGEQRDFSVNLDYLRLRYYAPETGRFLSRDTVEGMILRPLSRNLFTYAHADPVNGVDPSGHRVGTLIGVGITLAIIGDLVTLYQHYYAEGLESKETVKWNGHQLEVTVNVATVSHPLNPFISAGLSGAFAVVGARSEMIEMRVGVGIYALLGFGGSFGPLPGSATLGTVEYDVPKALGRGTDPNLLAGGFIMANATVATS